MAGVTLTTAGSATEKIKGPFWVFVDVAVPAAGATVTLTTDTVSGWKTPDATANPNAVCIGCTNGAIKASGSTNTTKEYCDQETVPFASLVDTTDFELEMDVFGAINKEVMVKTRGWTASVPSAGVEKLSFGSLDALPSMSVLILFKMDNDATKYGYILYYSCDQVEVTNFDGLTRKNHASSKLKFVPKVLAGRATGQNVGEIVKGL